MKGKILALLSGRGSVIVGLLKALRRIGLVSKNPAFDLGLMPKPEYAFGMHNAAKFCRDHGMNGFSAIEFGVAGGNGLKAMEQHALYLEKRYGLKIDVFGFDTGTGMPKPTDHRDIPYVWRESDFMMDESKLRSELTKAVLMLGDVGDSITCFTKDSLALPIGFISFDLDYYSSTMKAFELLTTLSHVQVLPRVDAHFDDIEFLPFQGETAAIEDFNKAREDIVIGRPNLFEFYVPFKPLWALKHYEIHFLLHPYYSVHLGSEKQLHL